MFEKYTDGARRVVVMARDEARAFGHENVGPEHILLGIAREGSDVAARVLGPLGVGEPMVRQHIEDMAGRGDRAQLGHIPFTVNAKRALELALYESLQPGHGYIGPEHLLLGLIDDTGGVAAQIIAATGYGIGDVRDRVMQLIDSRLAAYDRTSLPREPGEEGAEERSFFTQALTMTMWVPDIAKVADSLDTREIEVYLRGHRARIWNQVTEQRTQLRSAAEELKAAEDAVMPEADVVARREHPELLALHDEAAVQEAQIAEWALRATALARDLRQKQGRDLTGDEVQQTDQAVTEIQIAIRQYEEWLDRVRAARRPDTPATPGRTPEDVGGTSRRSLVTRIRSRFRQRTPSSDHSPDHRYQEMFEILTRMRKLRSDIGTERKRAALQLWQAARKVAERDEGFRKAKARFDAASEDLVSALRDALLPEVRTFIGQSY